MTRESSPLLKDWLEATLALDKVTLEPLAPEASTRRFYRIEIEPAKTHIVIDSPPMTENNEQFANLAEVFRRNHVPVPEILSYEAERGYFVVEDFGRTELLAIYPDPVRRRFAIELALDSLIAIQLTQDASIPPYSRQRLLDEVGIFEEWCCGQLLDIESTPLTDVTHGLVSEIDQHPKVTVHRDYHGRNLLLNNRQLGIVDFQDALVGSCVYDFASLVYDCYFDHDSDDIEVWVDRFRTRLRHAKLPCMEPQEAFVQGVEVTAIQRMLKAVGIFARLWFKQKKSTHLGYMVPVLRRVVVLAARNELEPMATWLSDQVIPSVVKATAELTP